MNAKNFQQCINAKESFVIWHFKALVNISHLLTSTGYYMYIETSSPRQQGDNAKLTSPWLQFSGSMCLKFYYHMYGTGIGTLKVNVNRTHVFSVSGDKGNKWLIATIDVNLSGMFAVRQIIMTSVRCLVSYVTSSQLA